MVYSATRLRRKLRKYLNFRLSPFLLARLKKLIILSLSCAFVFACFALILHLRCLSKSQSLSAEAELEGTPNPESKDCDGRNVMKVLKSEWIQMAGSKMTLDLSNEREDSSDHERIIRFVRCKFLIQPPSTSKLTLAQEEEAKETQNQKQIAMIGESKIVTDWFRNRINGIFVEIGVKDGIKDSITVELERNQNWKGLLIPPCRNGDGKGNYSKVLKSKERNSIWIAKDVCLSNIENDSFQKSSSNAIVPLRLLLAGVNFGRIDLLSLDFNSDNYDLGVIYGFPFNSLRIRMILIKNVPKEITAKIELRKLGKFLEKKGFKGFRLQGKLSQDRIFLHAQS